MTPAEPREPRGARFTVKRFPEYGWAVLDNGVKLGDERGPWYAVRRSALLYANRLNAETPREAS